MLTLIKRLKHYSTLVIVEITKSKLTLSKQSSSKRSRQASTFQAPKAILIQNFLIKKASHGMNLKKNLMIQKTLFHGFFLLKVLEVN